MTNPLEQSRTLLERPENRQEGPRPPKRRSDFYGIVRAVVVDFYGLERAAVVVSKATTDPRVLVVFL